MYVYILNTKKTHLIEVPGITLGILKKKNVSTLLFTNIFVGRDCILKISS